MSFNAVYGGGHENERARIKHVVRSEISEARARAVLRATEHAMKRITAVPPGDTRLGTNDPNFRRSSREQARAYSTETNSAVERLAAAAALIYQVRCSLLHGAKHPENDRDAMLVKESVRVLEVLLPEFD